MAKSKPQLTLKELRKAVDSDGAIDLSLKELKEKDVPVKDLSEIMSLRQLDLSVNHLETLPDNFGNLLVRLTKLDLSKNRLTRLPGNIGRLQNLEHLDLFQNQLVGLPASFANLKKLKWLDLKNNPWAEPRLVQAAALCISAEGCGTCARKTVAIMANVQKEEEAAKQEQQRLEREKAEAKKKAEEAIIERQRQEKKQAKEKRKAEAMKARSAASEVERTTKEVMNGTSKKALQNGSGKKPKINLEAERKRGFTFFLGWLLKLTLLVTVILGLTVAGLTVVHSKGDYSQENLLKSLSVVASDVRNVLDAARARSHAMTDSLRAACETVVDKKTIDKTMHLASEYVEDAKVFTLNTWNALSKRVSEIDWAGLKEKVMNVFGYYLGVVGKFFKTHGPTVHRYVRDYYVYCMKAVYQGGLTVFEWTRSVISQFV